MTQDRHVVSAIEGLHLTDCREVKACDVLKMRTNDTTYNPLFMDYAVAEANHCLKHKGCGPFGACIVLNNVIVGLGHNQVVKKNDPTCHAEVDCIRTACKLLKTYSLEGAVLYSSCEPCPMCLTASKWANITKVYYANTQKDADQIGFRDQKFYEMFQNGDYKEWCVREIHPDAIRTFEEYGKHGVIY